MSLSFYGATTVVWPPSGLRVRIVTRGPAVLVPAESRGSIMINSVLSRKGAKYVCFDIENFYLSTPLGIPEYVKIQLSKIPDEFRNIPNLYAPWR